MTHSAFPCALELTASSERGNVYSVGTLINFDIDVFVDAIIEGPPFTEYYTAYPTCDHLNGDVNGDGLLNNLDIDLFVGLVIGNGNSARTTLTWDAENRLRSFGPTPGSEAESMIRVEFGYDYMGRRVEKAVFEWEAGSPGSWELLSRTRFVYDGWNMIEELEVPTSGDPTVLRQYTWGLDLSGQNGNSTVGGLHGAGGIGGLLAVLDTNNTTTTSDDRSFAYCYDANGNVGQLVEWASGAGGSSGMAWSAGRLAATYEYDPYGNIVGPDADGDGNIAEEAGTYADINPFRFSTKFLDAETGLYYYGYRYYSPRLGRWISRDPIGEDGGTSLYSYTLNDPLGLIDPDGLAPVLPPGWGPALRPLGPANLKPPGTCTRERFRELDRQVGVYCKAGKRNLEGLPLPPGGATAAWCAEAIDRGIRAKQCARARGQINIECFLGGNLAHQTEEATAIGVAARTFLELRKHCGRDRKPRCPPVPAPAPEPVADIVQQPVPRQATAPASQPSPGWGVIRGLGRGLIGIGRGVRGCFWGFCIDPGPIFGPVMGIPEEEDSPWGRA
ncbi:MAG: hypothetical protein IPM64_10770 [Phycisphaerales bacterium]|nr:hypothetical protein [Phycisphaerales bacterium]